MEKGMLPPGQRLVKGWPVSHYGPVPRFRPERWTLQVFGATANKAAHSWTFEEVTALPKATVVADLHCASGTSTTGHTFFGIPARILLDLAPPAEGVSHVMAWAEYGYSANLRLEDFIADSTVMATHHDDEVLTAEHGFPLRLVVPHLYGYKGPKWLRGIEYMTQDRRGFWEERGFHNIADPWTGRRHSYQEDEDP
ncbi:molybdopterin-dependent oxidoreductase [Streptomyces sp. NBC_00056]|uniref:molybdopterin-dependent oxidoreductase n=1 Tax=unclassified Streptomyces TaxID=2593676 RepID=UPI002E822BB0|nr:molybdopterin-dependent oxidoreductase [Streptomyces sp. NBC_00569]WUB91203.1 molybdopterin-dependent oxidoreductase [Streptomyces sp. NBC_00569]